MNGSPLGTASINSQRARATRLPVRLVCEVRQGQRPWARVVLYDLSESGFSMDWLPLIEIGRPLWVRIPGINLLQAHVRWRKNLRMGCEFTSRLYGPVLEHLARQTPRQEG